MFDLINKPLERWRTRLVLQRRLRPIEWDFYIRKLNGTIATDLETGAPLLNQQAQSIQSRVENEPELVEKVFSNNPKFDMTGKALAYYYDIWASPKGKEQNTMLTAHSETGSGKSLTMLGHRAILDPNWNAKKICMSRMEVMERVNLFKFNVCFQQDEDESDYGMDVQHRAAEYKNFFNANRMNKVSGIVCTPKKEAVLDEIAKFSYEVLARSVDGNWSLAAQYEGRHNLSGFVLTPHPKFVLEETIEESEKDLNEYFDGKKFYMEKLQNREGLGNSPEDIFKRNQRIIWFVSETTCFVNCLEEKKGEIVVKRKKLINHIDQCFPFQHRNQMIEVWADQFIDWFETNINSDINIPFPSKGEIVHIRKNAIVEREPNGRIKYSDYLKGEGDFKEIRKVILRRTTGIVPSEVQSSILN